MGVALEAGEGEDQEAEVLVLLVSHHHKVLIIGRPEVVLVVGVPEHLALL